MSQSQENDSNKKVDPIDIVVGERLMKRRRLMGYSQSEVAEATGVTIQQIQKYEKAVNRISSSRLYKLARLLKVPVSYFFTTIDSIQDENTAFFAEDTTEIYGEDIQDGNESEENATDREIIYLVRAYNNISNQNVRKHILELTKSIASS
ncbi:MAG: helix-turn-helix domain-containing protein [Rickettsiaceae bacterium]|nr:helix-turn-helix domain-containing protein [Rickettsiaceae bacterium]